MSNRKFHASGWSESKVMGALTEAHDSDFSWNDPHNLKASYYANTEHTRMSTTAPSAPPTRNTTLTPQALTGYIGASIPEVDLNTLTDEDVHAIRQALNEHLVLFFSGEHLSANNLAGFAERLGEIDLPHTGLRKHPDNPKVMVTETTRGKGGGNNTWHTDVSFDEHPPAVSILQAIELPEVGGDTLFASMYAAFESLSQPLRNMVEGMEALHDGLPYFTQYLISSGTPNGEARLSQMRKENTTAIHPVVRRHPETGRKALYVNRLFTHRIMGLSDIESRNLLNLLYDHVEQASFQVRWCWSPGDVAIWDNRCAMHYASEDFSLGHRLMHRVTLKGERPLG